jgi:hypothetical protein
VHEAEGEKGAHSGADRGEITAKEESRYQMLLQVAAGTRLRATTEAVNIT